MRWYCPVLCLVVFSGAAGGPVLAVAQDSAAVREQYYDIPSSALNVAIAHYARISHVNIIYDKALTEDHTSAGVQGRHTPQVALLKLLQGTGLSSRFTDRHSAVIYDSRIGEGQGTGADETSPQGIGGSTIVLHTIHVQEKRKIGGNSVKLFKDYANSVLSSVDRRLRPEIARRNLRYTIVLWLWIDGGGEIERVELDDFKGTHNDGQTIAGMIRGMRFDAPPQDMPAPIRISIDVR